MRLKIRLLLLYTCVGIAVLAVVGSVLFVQVRNNRSADLEQEFQNQLMHLDFALTNLIEEAESDVSQLSENEIVRITDDEDFTSFLNANESTFEYNIGETEQSIIDILNSYMTTHSYVNSVYMGRENGTFVRSHPRTSPTQYDPRERPWYILGKENPGQVMITEPYESVTTTDINIGVVTALVGDDGEVYGVLGADITLNNLTDYMSDFEVGYQGHMLLADENGIIVAFSDSKFLFENIETLLGDTASDMMNRSQGVMTVETGSGSFYLYLYTSPELGWKLAVMAPTGVVNGVIQGPVFIALFGLFIALALLSLLTFIGLNRSIINPLKRLSEVTLDIASRGDLSRKTGINTKNEIGALAASFDRMTDVLSEKGKALSASETRYRRLFEAAQDGVLILDAETGMVVDVNPYLVELLGYSREQFIEKTIWDLGTFRDIIPSRDNFLELQRQEYVRYEDLPLETTDGRQIEVEFISNVYLVGDKKVIQCNIRNITDRKRIEKAAAAALRESEEKYREVVERANDGIIILQDEIIQYSNQRVSAIAGYESKEIIGTSITNYIHPNVLSKVLERYKRRMAGEHVPQIYDTVLVHKDGNSVNVELNAGIINYQGKPADMVIIRDITERKKAEKILSESESKLRTIFESVTDAIFVFDMSGFIREINKAACEMHGYTYNELIGTHAKNLVAPESHKHFADYLLMVGKGQPFSMEAKDIRKDGTIFDIEARGVPIVWNGEIHLLGLVRDITERKGAEQALRESEERYKSLFSKALDGICLADAETGNIIDCNQALAAMVGRDRTELIGQYQSILHPPTIDKELLSPTFKQHIADKEGQVLETQIITKAGEIREVEIKANILDLQGVKMLQGIFRDITERKKTEQEIQFKGKLLDAAADSILVHDLSGRIIYANKAAEEFRGYARGELIGKDMHELSIPEYAQMFNERIAELKQKGEIIFESAHYRHDGSTIPIEVHALLIDRAGEKLILRIGRDITERKKAEHQIKERMKELKAFFNLAELTVRESISPEELYQEIANMLPQSWQYAEIACCRIVLDDREFRTKNFRESAWLQSAPVKVHGSVVGRIDVGYLEERPEEYEGPFLKEERLLINTIAERISRITERKRAEEALRESERKMRSLTENSPDIIMIIDREGILLFINRAEGRTVEEFLGVSCYDYILPEYRHEYIETAERVFRTGEPDQIEIRGRNQKNLISWWETRFVPLESNGEIKTLMLIATDITERKQAEEALRNSEEKLRATFKSMNDAVLICDLNINVVDVNEATLRILDLKTKEELKGHNALKIIRFKDEETVMAKLLHTFKEKISEVHGEYGIILPDGREMDADVITSAMYNDDGNHVGFINVIRDITERKRAEQALRESEKKFREMAELLPEVVFECDIQGNVTFANKVAFEKFGYTQKDFDKGVTVQQFITPADRKRAEKNIEKILRGIEKGPFEYIASRKDGYEFPTIAYSSAIIVDGTPVGLRGIILDITERKRAEEELVKYKNHLEELVKERTTELDKAKITAEQANKAKITAEQANKAKSDFLANMSHEIRTPLSTIIGFSELLYDETKGPLNNDQKKYLGYVTSSGQHLLSLINDILDLSKVEAGKMNLLSTRFSISDLLKNSLSFIAEKALKHNIKLLSEISADVDIIEADERKVKQIIYNLLSNAAKFTPDGGAITIGANIISSKSTALPDNIRKGLTAPKYVLVSVKDTGIGIAKKDQSKLFTEFSQIEEPYAKKYEGTGLGLALSKRLVALHGGRIWFESKGKGKGCTFYFILPLKTSPKT